MNMNANAKSKLSKAVSGVLLLGTLGLSACYRERVVYREPPPPVVYAPPPQPAPAGADVVVTEPPPADVVESYGPAPGPDFVWVGGFYTWRGGRYFWHPGVWQHRPWGSAVWVTGRWQHGDRGWIYARGYWR